MSALDDIKKIPLDEISPLEAAVFYLSGKHFTDAENAAEELGEIYIRLSALEHLAAVARDVNEWLKTIDMGGTGHQRSLESALAELEDK